MKSVFNLLLLSAAVVLQLQGAEIINQKNMRLDFGKAQNQGAKIPAFGI